MDIQRFFENLGDLTTSNMQSVLTGGDGEYTLAGIVLTIVAVAVVLIVILKLYRNHYSETSPEGFDVMNSNRGVMSPTQFQMKFRDGRYEGFDNNMSDEQRRRMMALHHRRNEDMGDMSDEQRRRMMALRHRRNEDMGNMSEQMRKLLAAKHILDEKGDNMTPDDVVKLRVINSEIEKMREGYEDVDDFGPISNNLSGCRDKLENCDRKLKLAMKRLSNNDDTREDRQDNRSDRREDRREDRQDNRSDRREDRREDRQDNRSDRREDRREDFGLVDDKMELVREISDSLDVNLTRKQRRRVANHAIDNDLDDERLRRYILRNYANEGFGPVDDKMELVREISDSLDINLDRNERRRVANHVIDNDLDDERLRRYILRNYANEGFDVDRRRARAVVHHRNDEDFDVDHRRAKAVVHHRNDEDFEGGNFLTANQMDDLSSGAFNVDNYETMAPVLLGKKKNQ